MREKSKEDIELAECLGLALLVLRRSRGLTLREVSAGCGWTPGTLSRYENGCWTPRVGTLQRIAAAMDVPLWSVYRAQWLVAEMTGRASASFPAVAAREDALRLAEEARGAVSRVCLALVELQAGRAGGWPGEETPERESAPTNRLPRKELAAPARPRRSVWTRRALAQLGKVPDIELAFQLGLSALSVSRKRERRELCRQYHRHCQRWSAEEEGYLGTAPDAEVARRLGRRADAVKMRRLKLGRPPHPAEANEEAGLSAESAARKRQQRVLWRQYHRWSAEEEGYLGTAPDGEVAQRLGRSAEAVKVRRLQLGRPPHVAEANEEAGESPADRSA